MSDTVNIVLFGKIPDHITTVKQIVQPECKILEHASTNEDAKRILPAHLDPSNPNRIRLIIMGGGFTNEDQDEVSQVEGAKSVPWMRPDPRHMAALGGKAPPAEVVAGRARKMIDEHLEELRDGKGAGEVWWF